MKLSALIQSLWGLVGLLCGIIFLVGVLVMIHQFTETNVVCIVISGLVVYSLWLVFIQVTLRKQT